MYSEIKSMDVSIIIVNYNTKKLLKICLESIYKHTQGISFEIIVSDNGSHDGSVEMLENEFPNVLVVKNNENLGFGAANNRGREIAHGRYIFYLNSDTILLNNAVKLFFDWWENAPQKESIGALGCNLKNQNGEWIHSYGYFVPLRRRLVSLFHTFLGVSKDTVIYFFRRKKECIQINHEQEYFVGKVPYITGADLFVRNNAFATFDERFFMYNEEVDMQFQMQKSGLSSFLIQDPKIIHLEGGSSEKVYFKIFYLFTTSVSELFISYCRFYEKNENKKILVFLLKVVIILIWLNPFCTERKKKIRRLLKKNQVQTDS